MPASCSVVVQRWRHRCHLLFRWRGYRVAVAVLLQGVICWRVCVSMLAVRNTAAIIASGCCCGARDEPAQGLPNGLLLLGPRESRRTAWLAPLPPGCYRDAGVRCRQQMCAQVAIFSRIWGNLVHRPGQGLSH